MRAYVIDWIRIETPIGKAVLEDYTWKSENKELEHQLNEEFGREAEFLTYEQRQYGVAPFILADQAIRKLGGKILRVKKHLEDKENHDLD